jgi:phosphatidylinositol glycan class Q protein
MHYEALLKHVYPNFPTLIWIIGCTGVLGITMILSICSDVLGLITIPLYISYLAATAIFRVQITMAGSLFRLFRGASYFLYNRPLRLIMSPCLAGKRKNVLQNRTDAWDYDLDQLLLGTILFTLNAFLFPTVLVYYLLFALASTPSVLSLIWA